MIYRHIRSPYLFQGAVASLLLLGAVTAQRDWRDAAGYEFPTFLTPMAWQPNLDIVRFGGGKLTPGTGVPRWDGLDITAVWDGQGWTEITGLTQAPSPRGGALMAFDRGRNLTVLFGGSDTNINGVVFNDTWEWDGVQWHQVSVPLSPPPRDYGAMAFDGQRVILFGGVDISPSGVPTFLGDTWAYDGVTWQQVAVGAAVAPLPRYAHSMVDEGSGIVLFGGYGEGSTLADTWRWSGSSWSQVAVAGPSSRGGHAMTFDPIRGVTLLSGGTNILPVFDTWQFDGAQWTELSTERTPLFNGYQSSAFHVPTGRWIVMTQAPYFAPRLSITSEFGDDVAYTRYYGVENSLHWPDPLYVRGPLRIRLSAGQPRPGETFELEFDNLSLPIVALGWSEANVSLAVIGAAPQMTLRNSAETVLLLPPAVGGVATLPITLPASTTLIGTKFYAQCLDLPFPDLASLRNSRGLEIGIKQN